MTKDERIKQLEQACIELEYENAYLKSFEDDKDLKIDEMKQWRKREKELLECNYSLYAENKRLRKIISEIETRHAEEMKAFNKMIDVVYRKDN